MGGCLMKTPSRPVGSLTRDQVLWVRAAAARAANAGGTPPLDFCCTDSGFEVREHVVGRSIGDRSDGRAVMLQCGRLVLDVRVAIRALGIHPAVGLLPDADQDDLLAIIQPQGHSRPTQEDIALAEAMPRLTATAESPATGPVTTSLLNRLRQAAKIEQAWLAVLTPAQVAVLPSLQQRDGQGHAGPPAAESTPPEPTPPESARPEPTPPGSARPESTPPGSARPESPPTASAGDRGTDGQATGIAAGTAAACTAVIGSLRDVPIARLQAGQALERVLLTAAGHGVAATVLPDIGEVADTRRQLRELIGGGLWPQCVIRLGDPSIAAGALW